MSKYYYGAWNNFLQLNWPLRFLLELISLVLAICLIIYLIRKIDQKKYIKIALVKAIVWCVTELIYLLGKNSGIAIRLEDTMKDWGKRMLQSSEKKVGWYGIIGILFLFLYLGAILIDLPIADNIPQYYLQEFSEFKQKCMVYEEVLSEGCENYPPLFEKKEVVEVVETMEDESTEENSEEVLKDIQILLNERGRGGSNIRRTPDLNGEVVAGVREDAVILYMNEYEHDGERYWLKVYLPEKNIEGWLSAKLVETEQLETIIEK